MSRNLPYLQHYRVSHFNPAWIGLTACFTDIDMNVVSLQKSSLTFRIFSS